MSDGNGAPDVKYTEVSSTAVDDMDVACNKFNTRRISPPDRRNIALVPSSVMLQLSFVAISLRRDRMCSCCNGANRNRVHRLCNAGMILDT